MWMGLGCWLNCTSFLPFISSIQSPSLEIFFLLSPSSSSLSFILLSISSLFFHRGKHSMTDCLVSAIFPTRGRKEREGERRRGKESEWPTKQVLRLLEYYILEVFFDTCFVPNFSFSSSYFLYSLSLSATFTPFLVHFLHSLNYFTWVSIYIYMRRNESRRIFRYNEYTSN